MKKRSNLYPFWRIVFCVFLLVLSQLLASILVPFFVRPGLLGEGLSLEEIDAVLLELMYANQTVILLVSYGIVLAAVWLLARKNKQPFLQFTGLSRPATPAEVLLGAAAGLSMAFWMIIAINLIPWPQALLESYAVESGALETARPALDFAAVVLVGPLVEEILFRGVVYDALCMLLPAGFAVVMQGLLFGGVHNTMIWMLYAALSGCLIGYVRKQTGSLRPCVAMHVAFNGASYLFDWIMEASGGSGTVVFALFIGSAFLLLLSLYGIYYRSNFGGENKQS